MSQDNTYANLLPKISTNTNVQLEPDTSNSHESITETEIPDKARDKLKELLDVKYTNIMSWTARDIGRTSSLGWISLQKVHLEPLNCTQFH